jgi:hypothetical protein
MPAANFENCKTLGFAGISAAYATVGSATTHKIRAFLVSNLTQGDLYVTWDNSRDLFPVAAGGFVLIDISANMQIHGEENYFLPIGTQFYVKQITAPVEKAIYISCLY